MGVNPLAQACRERRGSVKVVVVRPPPVDTADEPEWPHRVKPAARIRTDHLKTLGFQSFPDRLVISQQGNLARPAGEEGERPDMVNGGQVANQVLQPRIHAHVIDAGPETDQVVLAQRGRVDRLGRNELGVKHLGHPIGHQASIAMRFGSTDDEGLHYSTPFGDHGAYTPNAAGVVAPPARAQSHHGPGPWSLVVAAVERRDVRPFSGDFCLYPRPAGSGTIGELTETRT